MTETRVRVVESNGVRLKMHLMGDPDKPILIMLHGLQDVSQSLFPVAELLTDSFQLALPDLRGHGESDRCGAYGFPAYVYDLQCIMRSLGLSRALCFGHSLGGQVLARFAALYPDLVDAIVMAEGLGPPDMTDRTDGAKALRMEAVRISFTCGAEPRPLVSLDHAVARLLANNPRLPKKRARKIARHLTHCQDDGQFHWAFDPRAGSMFAAPEDSYRYWPYIQCPSLIVNGKEAHEFWRKLFPEAVDWSGKFGPGELEARVALMPNAELREIENAGHMLHFDAPEQLAKTTLAFFKRRGFV